MKFQRQAVRIADALHPRGRTLALRADEVSRHAVRLVVVDRARDQVRIVSFADLPSLLRAGDLVVVNDAATLPASLYARLHVRSASSSGSPPASTARAFTASCSATAITTRRPKIVRRRR